MQASKFQNWLSPLIKSAELSNAETGALIGGAGGTGLGIIRSIIGDNKFIDSRTKSHNYWVDASAKRQREAFTKLKDAILHQRAWDNALDEFYKLPESVQHSMQEAGVRMPVPYPKENAIPEALKEFKWRREAKLDSMKLRSNELAALKKGRLGNALVAGGILGSLGLLGGAGIGKLTSLFSEKNASFNKQALSPAYLEEMAGLAKMLDRHKQSIHLAAGAKGRKLGTALTNANVNAKALSELIPGMRLKDAETVSKYLSSGAYKRGVSPTTLGEMLNGPISPELKDMRRMYSGTDKLFEHIGGGFLHTFRPPAFKAPSFSL